jgi:hypothetical protein
MFKPFTWTHFYWPSVGLQLVVTVLWLNSVTQNFEYKGPVYKELLGVGILAATVGQVHVPAKMPVGEDRDEAV